jgi:hypothetical protein
VKTLLSSPSILKTALFGEHGRYKLTVFYTRENKIAFLVDDAAVWDESTDSPACIRIADTLSEALAGLELPEQPFQFDPQPGDFCVNLDKHPGLVVQPPEVSVPLLECPVAGDKWVFDAAKVAVIRDDKYIPDCD